MMKPLVIAMSAAAALMTAGCMEPGSVNSGGSAAADNSRNSLDWAGTYRGVLPCADCEGIETIVTLGSDGSYTSQSRYLGKGKEIFSERGNFTWNAAGSQVTFDGSQPARYAVGENKLTRLSLDGTSITGPLAEHYVMAKQGEGVTEKYWKLVELNGRPVPALDREPHFILKAQDKSVIGFGGCNRFSGSFTLDESAARIRFGQVASTMMACSTGMDVESEFHKVLNTADNYSLHGDTLTLNRARMAPLARFEAVYLR